MKQLLSTEDDTTAVTLLLSTENDSYLLKMTQMLSTEYNTVAIYWSLYSYIITADDTVAI